MGYGVWEVRCKGNMVWSRGRGGSMQGKRGMGKKEGRFYAREVEQGVNERGGSMRQIW